MTTEAKYLKVARILQKRIEDGVYKTQAPLPNQKTLADELQVSRLTVKKALDGLQRKGLVYKESGLGTFVIGPVPIQDKFDSPANAFSGLANLLGSDEVTSDIIEFNVEFPSEDIQHYLKLKSSDPVYNIRRLRRLEGKPLILEHTFMPVHLVPNLTEDILHNSIYNYLHHDLKLKFGVAYRKIKAAKADDWDQKYLKAKKDDPILELEQIVWLNNGQPVEYSTSRNRYDERNYVVLETNSF